MSASAALLSEALEEVTMTSQGELCTWMPNSPRKIKGIGEYMLESGMWKFVAAAGKIDPDLKFPDTTMEQAVANRLGETAMPHQVVMESKKILNLLTGWRRAKRKEAKMPNELTIRMKKYRMSTSAKGRCLNAFMGLSDSEDSLESIESSECQVVTRKRQAAITNGPANNDKGDILKGAISGPAFRLFEKKAPAETDNNICFYQKKLWPAKTH